jgi:predicted RNA-binding protein YlqC (UPF0109 family)
MDALTHRVQPDRSKINLSEPHEVHYWLKHLNVSKEELEMAIGKVGNSAAAVRKELATLGGRDAACARSQETGSH